MPPLARAAWTVTPRGSMALDISAVSGVDELSGVAYLGEAEGESLFAAVQDDGNQLVTLAVSFDADGSLVSAKAKSTLTLAGSSFDFEGVAYMGTGRNSVFVSEEDTPALREFDLTSGAAIQTVLPPAVFTNIRPNRGFESLTRSIGGASMWTANEEALSVDGPVSTDLIGTTVRLQQFGFDGDVPFPKSQYAYEVNPVHAANPDRSGLVDLLSLPDGTLLALERSTANALPVVQNRIYQIDLDGATDISGAAFDAGLVGQSFTSVSKTLLWSGSVGGAFGENMEGLALGPRLADGSWVLFGVVDDGDPLSGNTVVAFQATPPACALAGDFNCSGQVNAMDYDSWRETFGSTELLFADGNGDGTINAADYTVWRDHLGAAESLGATESVAMSTPVPEPGSFVLLLGSLILSQRGWRKAGTWLPRLGLPFLPRECS